MIDTFLLSRPSPRLLFVVDFVFGVTLLTPSDLPDAHAQGAQCQEPSRDPTKPIFRSGDVIHGDFDSSISPEMEAQIRSGLDSMNNSGFAPCSGITFTGADPDLVEPNGPEPAYVQYRFAPLLNGDGSLNISTAARFTVDYLREDGTILAAAVTL